MKKAGLIVLMMWTLLGSVHAHDRDDSGMLRITPVVPERLELQQEAKSALSIKLKQIIVQNGFGSTAANIALIPDVTVVEKSKTCASPEKYSIKLRLTLYVIDINEREIIAEKSYYLTGIDRLQSRAILQAINRINPRGDAVRTFMINLRSDIIEYYSSRLAT